MDIQNLKILVVNKERFDAYVHKFDPKLNLVGGLGFVETPKGNVALENDSCHWFLDNDDEVHRFSLTEDLGGGKFTFSNTTANMSLNHLRQFGLLDEVKLSEFVDSTFGQRKRANYKELTKTLDKAFE